MEDLMSKQRIIWLAIVSAVVVSVGSARAQGAPTSGLYRIISGRYTECCGIAGRFVYSLPNYSHTFVALAIDAQRNLAQMKFLGEDMETVFRTFQGFPGREFSFSFSNGMVFPDHIRFGKPFRPMLGPGAPQFSYIV